MDHDSTFLSLGGVPDVDEVVRLLRTGRDEILNDWAERVRSHGSVETERTLSDPLLLDHLPQLLDSIIERLELFRGRDDAEYFAAVHGFARRVSGYDLIETVMELMMFRRAIWSYLTSEEAPVEPAYAVMERVDGMIDRAVITSLSAFLDPSAGILVRVPNSEDGGPDAAGA